MPVASMRDRETRRDELGEQLRMGALVRASREHAGLLQRELADRLGVHFSTIAKWESGASPIPRRRWQSIEKVLEVPLGRALASGPAALSVSRSTTSPRTETTEVLRERKCVHAWWVKRSVELLDAGLTLPESDAVRDAMLASAASAIDRLRIDIGVCSDAVVEEALLTALSLVRGLRVAQLELERQSAA